MPSIWIPVEVLAGVLALLLVVVVAVFLRRRRIARGRVLTLCGIRTSAQPRWRLGLVRMGSAQLEWFSLNGLSRRPHHIWTRGGLELSAPVPLADGEGIALLPEAVLVVGTYLDFPFDLAMRPEDYRALRIWLESAPPSFNTDLTIA